MKHLLIVKLIRNLDNEVLAQRTFTRDSQKEIINLLINFANEDRSLINTHYNFEYKFKKGN